MNQRKRDRFDDDALEFVFEDADFRRALEAQDDGALARVLGALMCGRYGSEHEQAAREPPPVKKARLPRKRAKKGRR